MLLVNHVRPERIDNQKKNVWLTHGSHDAINGSRPSNSTKRLLSDGRRHIGHT